MTQTSVVMFSATGSLRNFFAVRSQNETRSPVRSPHVFIIKLIVQRERPGRVLLKPLGQVFIARKAKARTIRKRRSFLFSLFDTAVSAPLFDRGRMAAQIKRGVDQGQ